jgi:hypothetical protein
MPRRPPRRWFERCVAGVTAGGGAVHPDAVCGAAWRDKSRAEKALAVREEFTMAAKKKKRSRSKKKPSDDES